MTIPVIVSAAIAGAAATVLTVFVWALRTGRIIRVRDDQLPFIDDVLADIENL